MFTKPGNYMERFLTTSAILSGYFACSFNGLFYSLTQMISDTVEKENSGYKLTLQDDMRWHVWPKLSIISGKCH